jgi:hypothetical protein
MSDGALTCPKCGASSVRRSRRVNAGEITRMMMGLYPFRCNSCNGRFWASVWLFSAWRWAKCPLCLSLNLTDWPKRHYRIGWWTEILTALGAQKYRCSRCRNNFVSFRPRSPEFEGEMADSNDLDFDDERTVSNPAGERVPESGRPGPT